MDKSFAVQYTERWNRRKLEFLERLETLTDDILRKGCQEFLRVALKGGSNEASNSG